MHSAAVQIKNCLKSTSYYEIYRRFPLCKGSHHVLPPNYHSEDKWNTKEDTGKSMMTHCGMLKGTSCTEMTSNSEKTFYPLLSEGIH